MDINEILKKLPPAPTEVTRWIHKDVVEKTYIIYDKKENVAVCTRCGHKFRTSRFDMKHNEEGECPKCKSRAVYKASGIGRKNLAEYFRVLIFTHRGNTVYGTLTEVTAEFKEMGKPQLLKWLSAIYVLGKEEQAYWKHSPERYWGPERWNKTKNIRLPHAPSPMNYYAEPKFAKTEIYTANLKTVFEKSCLKYGWQPYLLAEFDPYEYIRYIDLFLKYQSIELLTKAGFESLVKEKVEGKVGSGCINWRGKDLRKILRLPQRHIRKLKDHEVDFHTLKVFQGLTEKEKMRPWQTIAKVAETFKYYRIEEIRMRTSPIEWSIWASKENVYQGDWIDYIKDCEKLGFDVRKKNVLFPDDFDQLHNELSEKVEAEENKEKSEKIEAIAREYALEVQDERFVLSIAHSQSDLNVESSKLCHCVKTYGDRVASGSTLIYFIRKKEEPDIPFYTLEIHPDGTFIQCRGKSNCSMTKEVEDFKEKVVAEFNRMLKKRERSAA